MNNTAKINIIKHVVLVLFMFFLYVLQSVPGLFVIRGVKPILLVSAAITVAMLEGEFAGGIYGAFAGLLCDTGGHLLFGFNGFIIAVCCIAAGILVSYLMRCNLLSCLLFVFVTLMLRGGIEYFFAFGMWNFENSSIIFTRQTFPTVVYSTAVSVPVFFLLRWFHRRFASIEENDL